MRDNAQNSPSQERSADIFAHLRSQDVEQFYAQYQLWVMRHRIPILENELAALRSDIAENQQHIQHLRPSAIALSVLARLQANGVSDIELLDQMLERGEDWLDRMMQRLDYCEQVEDFIQGDYTQWCVHSLEGAYDWIDTMRGSLQEAAPGQQAADESSEAEVQATAELLLHKLSSDDEETAPDARRTSAALTPVGEESAESTEIPTYEQALDLLGTTEITPAKQVSAEAEAGAPEQVSTPVSEQQAPASSIEEANEQPAPWYSANPEDVNEPFDFTHPHSMDDWIKILQAETSASQGATAEPQAAASIPETLAIPHEEAAQNVVPAEDAAPIQPEAQEEPRREAAIATEQSEMQAQREHEAEVGDFAGATGLAVEEETARRALEETILPTSEAEMTAEIAEKAISAEPAQSAEEETIRRESREQSATEQETASRASAALEQSVVEQDIASRTNTAPGRPVVEQEETGAEEQEPARTLEGMEEKVSQVVESEREQPQYEVEEAGIVNAIFEPEGEQRPWYEYLAIDKTISGELHNAHELAEHSLFSGEQLNHQGELLDETQPIARQATQASPEEQATQEDVPSTMDSEPLIGINSSEITERSELTSAESKEETPEEHFPTLTYESLALESEASASLPQASVTQESEAEATSSAEAVAASGIAAGEEAPASAKDAAAIQEGDETESALLAIPQEESESKASQEPPAITESELGLESQRSAVPEPVQKPPKKLSFWQRLFRRKRKK